MKLQEVSQIQTRWDPYSLALLDPDPDPDA
jgi:hypothetical protein